MNTTLGNPSTRAELVKEYGPDFEPTVIYDDDLTQVSVVRGRGRAGLHSLCKTTRQDLLLTSGILARAFYVITGGSLEGYSLGDRIMKDGTGPGPVDYTSRSRGG